jgi:hypothetical protein
VRKVTSRLSVRFSSTEYLATPSRKRTAGPMGGDSTATLKPPCKHRKVSSCSNVSNGTTIHNTNKSKAKTDVVPTNPNLLFRGMSTTALSKMPRLASRFGHFLAKQSSSCLQSADESFHFHVDHSSSSSCMHAGTSLCEIRSVS